MITSLDRTHAGFYRCIVRNRMGALLQRQTEVQVACEYHGGLGVGWGEAGEGLRGPHALAALRAEPVPAEASHVLWVLMVTLAADPGPCPHLQLMEPRPAEVLGAPKAEVTHTSAGSEFRSL